MMICYPRTVPDIQRILASARNQKGCAIVLRGSNLSYDGAQLDHPQAMVLDFSHMNKMEWLDKTGGILRAEPGVTVNRLQQFALANGYWLDGLPDTPTATLGGCLAMNTTGTRRNSGSIGESVQTLDLILADGQQQSVSPFSNNDESSQLFYAAVGGLGMPGITVSAQLKLQDVSSRQLLTRKMPVTSLARMFRVFEDHAPLYDYAIGWINGQARGTRLGSGLVLLGRFSERNEAYPPLPPTGRGSPDLLQEIASARIVRSLVCPPFKRVKLLNKGLNRMLRRHIRVSQENEPIFLSIAEFHSQLPFTRWKRFWHMAVSKQCHFFQPFVPGGKAQRVFRRVLIQSQKKGFIPIKCALRQHNSSAPFVLSPAFDGFSLELVYHVPYQQENEFLPFLKKMAKLVIEEGGHFQFDRDCVLDADLFRRSANNSQMHIDDFQAMKQEYDPGRLFQSNLYNRLFNHR